MEPTLVVLTRPVEILVPNRTRPGSPGREGSGPDLRTRTLDEVPSGLGAGTADGLGDRAADDPEAPRPRFVVSDIVLFRLRHQVSAQMIDSATIPDVAKKAKVKSVTKLIVLTARIHSWVGGYRLDPL
jgi:hypothetical protein